MIRLFQVYESMTYLRCIFRIIDFGQMLLFLYNTQLMYIIAKIMNMRQLNICNGCFDGVIVRNLYRGL